MHQGICISVQWQAQGLGSTPLQATISDMDTLKKNKNVQDYSWRSLPLLSAKLPNIAHSCRIRNVGGQGLQSLEAAAKGAQDFHPELVLEMLPSETATETATQDGLHSPLVEGK